MILQYFNKLMEFYYDNSVHTVHFKITGTVCMLRAADVAVLDWNHPVPGIYTYNTNKDNPTRTDSYFEVHDCELYIVSPPSAKILIDSEETYFGLSLIYDTVFSYNEIVAIKDVLNESTDNLTFHYSTGEELCVMKN